MADLKFSVCENGYSINEVERYILRLQNEYKNAVEWGADAEKKLSELEKRHGELSCELEEKVRLSEEKIEALKAKNKELESAVLRKKEDDIGRSNGIINSAQQKAEEIINSAKNAVKELFDETLQKLYTTREETEELERKKEETQQELERLNMRCDRLRERLRDFMEIFNEAQQE